MQRNECEIIVLKPTQLFRLFLKVLRPDINWSNLSLFQQDATAYSIKKSYSDDALIEQMEYHYLAMMRHEVIKWLGDDVGAVIKISFFDFLRFFKFEIHTDVMVMDSSFEAHRHISRAHSLQ